MNLDTITSEIKRIGSWLSKNRYPLVGTLIVILFALTVYRIDYLSATERDEEAYQEQLQTVTKIEFDQDVIEEILRLTDTDIDIRARFPGDRTNPF